MSFEREEVKRLAKQLSIRGDYAVATTDEEELIQKTLADFVKLGLKVSREDLTVVNGTVIVSDTLNQILMEDVDKQMNDINNLTKQVHGVKRELLDMSPSHFRSKERGKGNKKYCKRKKARNGRGGKR